MRKTTAIIAALGLFAATSWTPVIAGSMPNTDRPAEFKVAQSQTTDVSAAKTKSKKKAAKKPKPTKKQRYERSN